MMTAPAGGRGYPGKSAGTRAASGAVRANCLVGAGCAVTVAPILAG